MQRRLGQLDLDLLASSDSLQIVHQDLRPLISLADVLRQRFHNDGLQVIRRGSDGFLIEIVEMSRYSLSVDSEYQRFSGRLRGSLAGGADALLQALALCDEIGQLEYKVWYFASLCYDQDQRDNQANGKRQEVQILFAKAAQASAWFDPELLTVPLETVRGWLAM